MTRPFSPLAAVLRRVVRRTQTDPSRPVTIPEVFTEIYRTHGWYDPESVSGPGSGVARTALIREDLVRLLVELRVGSVLDAGCGDFNWLRFADLPVQRYTGIDVVPGLVAANQVRHGRAGREFRLADVTVDRLPRADLILCRDCLVHLPLRDVSRALGNFRRSGATYLLATTFRDHGPNVDIPIGHWQPLNLERAPFGLPPPVATIDERCPPDRGDYADKQLALWRLGDMPLTPG
jgi:SAM-dependent methyltransferase